MSNAASGFLPSFFSCQSLNWKHQQMKAVSSVLGRAGWWHKFNNQGLSPRDQTKAWKSFTLLVGSRLVIRLSCCIGLWRAHPCCSPCTVSQKKIATALWQICKLLQVWTPSMWPSPTPFRSSVPAPSVGKRSSNSTEVNKLILGYNDWVRCVHFFVDTDCRKPKHNE